MNPKSGCKLEFESGDQDCLNLYLMSMMRPLYILQYANWPRAINCN